jgi:excisionase family DNA binding protein
METKKKKQVGLVDPGVVAEWMSVSRNTVLNWARDGKISSIVVGKTYRFDLVQLAKELKLPSWIQN